MSLAILACSSSGQLPCNPGGAAPLLHTVLSRFTGSLFTGRAWTYCGYCGVTSAKSMSHSRSGPRRVEQSGSESSTKAAPLLLFFLSQARNMSEQSTRR